MGIPFLFLQTNPVSYLLHDVLLIVAIAVVSMSICHIFRLPTIVGLLCTGVIAGPYINDKVAVNVIADIGIVFLLFGIGIQFSIKEVMRIKKVVFLGGSMQIILTMALVLFLWKALHFSFAAGILMGFLVSMTSTAVMMKILQKKLEDDSPHGRASLGVSIFQDIMSVPMMLVIPILGNADANTNIWYFLGIFLGKSILVMGLVMTSALWAIPKILYYITRSRDRELFLMAVLLICLAIAWITSMVGLSLALGAFLAGLIISESEYGNRALSSILPFQDLFVSFFFVSMGMLLDVNYLYANILIILGLTFGAIVLKTVAATGAILMTGYPLRTAIITGILLAQIGEFSFVLCKEAIHPQYHLLSLEHYQQFLGVSVCSMMLSPFIASFGPKIANLFPSRARQYLEKKSTEFVGKDVNDHLIIVGYGLNGRNLARVAIACKIPFVIIEMNPKTVHEERVNGLPIFYGDSTENIVLEHVGIHNARIMVIAISDSDATRRTTELARQLNPKLHILTRTRYSSEIPKLMKFGANEVIPEEFETSVEIFARVLRQYLVPKQQIGQLIQDVRADSYEMLRSLSSVFPKSNVTLPDIEITTVKVAHRSPLHGKTLAQIELRKKYKITILAIQRQGYTITNPNGETIILAGDVVFLIGLPTEIYSGLHLFA